MRLHLRWTLVITLVYANYPSGIRAEDTNSVRLIRDAWTKYQIGKLDDAALILEDAVQEAQAARPTQFTQINEGRAKLAWLKSIQGKRETAEYYIAQIKKNELRPDDAGRLEIVLAKYSQSPQEVSDHLERAIGMLVNLDGWLQADCYMQLSRIQFELGRLPEAAAACQRARSSLNLDTNGLELFRNWLLESRIASARERYNDALKAVTQARVVFKEVYSQISLDERVDYYCMESDCSLEAADFVSAYEFLNKARVELVAQHGDAHASLVPLVVKQSEILIEQGRLPEARIFIDWSLNAGKGRSEWVSQALVARGRMQLAAGEYQRARADLTNGIAQQSSAKPIGSRRFSHQLDSLKAMSLQGPSESVVTGIRELQNSSLNKKDSARACLILAQQKCFVGRPETASTLVTRAIEYLESLDSNPASIKLESQLVLAELCLLTDDHVNASNALESALQLHRTTPTLSKTWLARILSIKALLFFSKKDFQTAQNYVEKALEIWNEPLPLQQLNAEAIDSRHPEKVKAYLLIAALQLEQNHTAIAEEQWRAALTVVSPQLSSKAIGRQLLNFGDVCSQTDCIVPAIWFYEKASSYHNSDPGIRMEVTKQLEQLFKQAQALRSP